VVDRPEETFEGYRDGKAYDAFMSRKYRRANQAYVDAYKRKFFCCQNPDCEEDGPNEGKMRKGFEVCFDFDHIERVEKWKAIGEIVHNGKTLKTNKPLLDAELAKCRLLCVNCHKQRNPLDDT